jgi:hypothetical protein
MLALIGVFLGIIIALSIVSWFSINRLSEFQNSPLNTQIADLQNKNNQLEDQAANYQAQISELENQTTILQNRISELQFQNSLLQNNTVRISNFTLNGIDNPVGLVWNIKFIAKIRSDYALDVDGLTLTLNINSNYNIERAIDMQDSNGNIVKWDLQEGEPYAVGVVKQGETKEIYGYIWNDLNDSAKLSGAVFVATLKIGNIVLDEARINM